MDFGVMLLAVEVEVVVLAAAAAEMMAAVLAQMAAVAELEVLVWFPLVVHVRLQITPITVKLFSTGLAVVQLVAVLLDLQ